MSLVKSGGSQVLADRLRQNLITKYGMGASTLPDSSCLLLDVSDSMDSPVNKYDGPSRIEELRKLAADFTDIRRFTFSDSCDELPRSHDVGGTQGGTNMGHAFEHVKRKGIKHAVLITDGQPDSESHALREAVGLKIDCFYVGPDPAPEFLERLARVSGGQYGKASLERLLELKAAVKERLMLAAPKRGIEL